MLMSIVDGDNKIIAVDYSHGKKNLKNVNFYRRHVSGV